MDRTAGKRNRSDRGRKRVMKNGFPLLGRKAGEALGRLNKWGNASPVTTQVVRFTVHGWLSLSIFLEIASNRNPQPNLEP